MPRTYTCNQRLTMPRAPPPKIDCQSNARESGVYWIDRESIEETRVESGSMI
ncbi:hypothetical protein ACSS6W_003351 [Trichoderma asperelloides]